VMAFGVVNGYNLLKPGSLDNAIQEFLLAWPSS